MKIGDEILVIGETTGVVEFKIDTMNVNDKLSSSAKKGDELTLKTPSLVRRNDKLYLIRSTDKSN